MLSPTSVSHLEPTSQRLAPSLFSSHVLTLSPFASSPFNDTYIAQLRNASETCGYNDYIAKALTFPPDGHFENPVGIKKNGEAKKDCDIFDSIFEEIFWINPCWASHDNFVGKTSTNGV